MRRPLFAFCISARGVELVCAFLPQAGLLLPLAAIFVLGTILTFLCRKTSRFCGLLLTLGALLGLFLTWHTRTGLERLQARYDGETVTLTAEVESTRSSYYPGVVNAVLHVREVDGEAANFRVECACLPKSDAGELLQGRFTLETPAETDQIETYADGIALSAELFEGLEHLGQGRSFRAWTARLQAKLSRSLRRGMAPDPAGVLAAMVTGDRKHLSTDLRTAYRRAGLSHVLVISGMHVSILCGDVLENLISKCRKQRSYASRRIKAVFSVGMSILLIGVTGFTPSVLRAGVAVWVSAVGVWVFGAPDALTSLGIAGILMTLGNSYAVCDIGFELSFAAVTGTLAGVELFRRSREKIQSKKTENQPERHKKAADKRGGWVLWKLKQLGTNIWEALCISGCACAATFPVLVLRGMSTSVYGLVSGVAVLWLVEPILLLGLSAAVLGLLPALSPACRLCAFGAEMLVNAMDRWALWVSGWPGAELYFDTAYAAIVCLLLAGLCVLALHWKVCLRVALPAILLTAAIAIGAGNAMERDVVRIELVGSKIAPAVVVTQNERAVVLYRGGKTTRNAVERVLERRGIQTIEVLIDLRMDSQDRCTLTAEQRVEVNRLRAQQTVRFRLDFVELEVLRTKTGCAARFTTMGHQFLTLSGTMRFAEPLSVEYLLASASRPNGVEHQKILTLSRNYRWMQELLDDTKWSDQTALGFRP